MILSNHAVDRASLRLWRIWRKTKLKEEGIYSWLERVSLTTLQRYDGKKVQEVRNMELKIRFIFGYCEDNVTLITVYRIAKNQDYYSDTIRPKNGKNRAYVLRKRKEWETNNQ